MSAPVTESHKRLVATIVERAFRFAEGNHKITPELSQLIADSEAKAVEQTNAQVESLLSAAKNAIPASEHPAEPTVQNWAWQIRNLGDDRRLVYADRDKLRAEVKRLGHLEAVLRSSAADMTAGSITAGGVADLRAENERLRRAYVRPDDIRAQLESATARAERAERELAKERARLKDMAAELAHCAGYIASVRTDRLITWHEELYALQTLEWAEGAFEIAEKANAVLEAHDAAMKEDAK